MSLFSHMVEPLEIVPLREAFPGEASHFTRWLEQHIEALSDRLGLRLTVNQREKAVGDFNVDLLCEDPDGHLVIVENQLERTDHSHLGQLLTYLVNLGASTAIWIVSEPRSEHQKVVNWLNEATSAAISFYLVKVEAGRIGRSSYAPLFSLISGPDRQAKAIGQNKKQWAESQLKCKEFWTGLLNKSRQGGGSLFATISPSQSNWILLGAGKTGIAFNYNIARAWGNVELYIDQTTGEKNKSIFDALYSQRDEIEKEFGASLDWQRMDDKRACRIAKRFTQGGLANPVSWPELQEAMIDAMSRLYSALHSRVNAIKM